jgi:hypothetical protein
MNRYTTEAIDSRPEPGESNRVPRRFGLVNPADGFRTVEVVKATHNMVFLPVAAKTISG